jgi:hypothetical protein
MHDLPSRDELFWRNFALFKFGWLFAMATRERLDMTLQLTKDELDLMKSAIEEGIRVTRDRERGHCTGLSSSGIELCRRRLQLEALLASVDAASKQQPPYPIHGSRLSALVA